MDNQRRSLILVPGCLALAACTGPMVIDDGGPGRGHGPPPHAPAHGYRAQTAHGLAVTFDVDLGAYRVVGHPGLFWHRGRYLRNRGGQWQGSPEPGGHWRPVPPGQVPPGLRRRGG